MDTRERFSDQQEVIRQALRSFQAGLWTCLPGYIVDYDSEKNTATVQPGIKVNVLSQDGTTTQVDPALLDSVPIVFPGGGGCLLTFPIKQGDECLVVFASRSIDGWMQEGGIQPQTDPSRLHDLSDAMCFVGLMSYQNIAPSISGSRTQLRSKDGETYVELDPDGQVVNVKAPGGMTFDTPTAHFTGNVISDQTVTASTDVVGGGISLKSHTHSGVQSGSENSGPPVG